MRYEMMFPKQIRKAIDENWPVTLAVGVLEYHSEHCVVGVDGILVVRALELLEQEIDMIMLPPYFLGTASHVVEKPERNGGISIDPEVVFQLMKQYFSGLLRVGFRNIHVFVHHQTENFVEGMPTDLAIKFAARKEIFAFLEKEWGENWWGDEAMQNYYDEHKGGSNPFNWIQVHPLMDVQTQEEFPVDHAGKQETSLMMAFCPEGVDMNLYSDRKWFAREARQASVDYGNRAKEMILRRMRKILLGGN
jgi:creatinine amidohydrolase